MGEGGSLLCLKEPGQRRYSMAGGWVGAERIEYQMGGRTASCPARRQVIQSEYIRCPNG